MADEKIIVELELDLNDKKLKNEFGKIIRVGRESGEEAGEEAADGFSKGFKDLTDSIGSVIDDIKDNLFSITAVIGTVFATREIVRASVGFEQIRTQIEILTGSAEKAAIVFQRLERFSAGTPFQLQDLAQAEARLISFGFNAGEAFEKLQQIGEAAAGSGSNVGDLALIFGQVSAAGKLTGERLLQLQERAIPIGDALAKTLGKPRDAIAKLVSDGKVGFKDFETAFKSLSEQGGIFAGSLDKQSKTLGGIISTLKDNINILQAAVGDVFSESLISDANLFIDVIQRVTRVVKGVGKTIFTTLREIGISFVRDFLTPLTAIFRDVFGFISSLFNSFGDQTVSTFSQVRNIVLLAAKGFILFKNIAVIALNGVRVFINKLLQTVTRFAGFISEQLAKIGQSSELVDNIAALGDQADATLNDSMASFEESKDRIFDFSAALKVDKALEEIERFATEAEAPLANLNDIFTKQGKKLNDTVKGVTSNINKQLVGGLARGLQILGAFVGKSLADSSLSFKSFGATVLGIIGDLMIQLGGAFIAIGFGVEAIKASVVTLAAGPAIAAGLALVILGGALKAFSAQAGGAVGLGAGGAPGGLTGGGGIGTADEGEIADEEERAEVTQQVSVTVEGSVFDSEETGLRLVDIITREFESTGATIVGAV